MARLLTAPIPPTLTVPPPLTRSMPLTFETFSVPPVKLYVPAPRPLLIVGTVNVPPSWFNVPLATELAASVR